MAAAATAMTASSHRAAFVEGTRQFDIVGYSALKALGRRHSVTSGTFRVAGRDWVLVCRFDPAALSDIGNGEAESIIFTPSSSSCKQAVPDAFRKWEARYVRDDRLRICCTVRVLEVESRPTSYCFVAAPSPPDTTRWLSALLGSGRRAVLPQRADVTFAVGTSRFDAHRLVLAARSPVFRAKFFGSSRDSRQRWFRVHDVGAPVFGAMLRFIYTDELPPEAAAPATAHDLLVAADLYDLERLRLMCERTLWESVLADGVSAALSVLLRVNGRHSCRQLEDLCVGSVAGAWEAATATDEYRELKASCPALLNDILEKVVVSRRRLGSGPPPPSPPSSEKMSASTYRSSDVWRGMHEFTIFGYSGVRRVHSAAGDFISSGTFEVGGHEWRILYYPSGYDDYQSDNVAALLQLVTGPADVSVTKEVAGTFIIGNHHDNLDDGAMVDFFHDFTDDSLENGSIVELAGVDDVKSMHVGRDDSLTVMCAFEFGVRVARRNHDGHRRRRPGDGRRAAAQHRLAP
ncbi:BTB/POZ and MATH domain-containing protein 2-like [Panicum virgatum]|uniref:BTB/POZ and MATH domain-containing protein 2-like n=1 Tax=Panicum virgatum TaxID=38727 RepID=UPI0019D58E6A|nr:BTB/POZ and MATH domain-containing protein 2-like [Panicum virgatum]